MLNSALASLGVTGEGDVMGSVVDASGLSLHPLDALTTLQPMQQSTPQTVTNATATPAPSSAPTGTSGPIPGLSGSTLWEQLFGIPKYYGPGNVPSNPLDGKIWQLVGIVIGAAVILLALYSLFVKD